jgi:hypothetical protein
VPPVFVIHHIFGCGPEPGLHPSCLSTVWCLLVCLINPRALLLLLCLDWLMFFDMLVWWGFVWFWHLLVVPLFFALGSDTEFYYLCWFPCVLPCWFNWALTEPWYTCTIWYQWSKVPFPRVALCVLVWNICLFGFLLVLALPWFLVLFYAIVVAAGKFVVPLNWYSVAICDVASMPLSDFFFACTDVPFSVAWFTGIYYGGSNTTLAQIVPWISLSDWSILLLSNLSWVLDFLYVLDYVAEK